MKQYQILNISVLICCMIFTAIFQIRKKAGPVLLCFPAGAALSAASGITDGFAGTDILMCLVFMTAYMNTADVKRKMALLIVYFIFVPAFILLRIFLSGPLAEWFCGALVLLLFPFILYLPGTGNFTGKNAVSDDPAEDAFLAESCAAYGKLKDIPEDGEISAFAELYMRLIRYFEKEEPFLKWDLSINDVAKALYSNKAYISKVISTYSKRNFCQFVNLHRINYAVRLFDKDPTLNVKSLAFMSGFHSSTSFNSSFKTYMKELPGEWCRKRRMLGTEIRAGEKRRS